MPDALPKIPAVIFGDDPATQVVTSSEAARAFLRFAPVVWQAGAFHPTVAEIAVMHGLSLETAAYQVRQLHKYGLLSTNGNPARGKRYQAAQRWLIGHEFIPQGTLREFLASQFAQRLEPMFAGYEAHVQAQGQPWWLELDFRRENYLQILTEHPGEEFPPLFTGFGFSMSPARAKQLHDELLNVYRRYLQPEPDVPETEQRRYYLMTYFARSSFFS